MSTKSKALLQQAKSRNKKQQKLETADDYQAGTVKSLKLTSILTDEIEAGVEFEDAAGKWRAGDAVKSMRFFQRALEVYETGLSKFPRSLDLAYNKARVQLEIATHPILVKQLRQPVIAALQIALESHRYALRLDQDNPDTLFNTSQVLTGIAEEIAKSETNVDTEALRFLEEALELQTRCLDIQELRYEEHLSQEDEITQRIGQQANDPGGDNEDGGVSIESAADHEGQWFTIVEPVTQDALIDTALAQLGTLTTMCGILSGISEASAHSKSAWVEEFSSKLLSGKLPVFAQGRDERLPEIALTKANFVSALLEAGFRANRVDVTTYKRERDIVFATPELNLERSIEALIANAKSLISFNSAVLESAAAAVDISSSKFANMRWNSLSAAIANLTLASKLPEIASEDLAKTHFLRGDCSILQRQMGLAPTRHQAALANAAQLLKNAEVFYRNAGKLSSDQEERSLSNLRCAMAQFLQQNNQEVFRSLVQDKGEVWLREHIEDMMDEGLLPLDFELR